MKKFFILSISFLLVVYGLLWVFSLRTYPVEYGVSFNQNHATSLGLDWKAVYEDMLQDLQPKYVRVAAMWSEVEAQKGVYTFDNVDWMLDKAAEYGAAVTLVIGQKAPRWPECHVPEWNDYDQHASREHVLAYVQATVERYKSHEALELWQVENEAFIHFPFGECDGYDREVVEQEVALVRKLDPDHNIMMTDSGELGLWKDAAKLGDVFGTTLYRVVRSERGRISTYDFVPPAAYALKAMLTGVSLDNFYVSELQAEPWFTNNNPTNTTVAEQEETMNPQRMQDHIAYVTHIGTNRAYLWGVEWWAYMRDTQEDGRYWDIAKEALR